MRQVIGWSTLIAILMLLFGCAGMQARDLHTAKVVIGPEGSDPVLWRVASRDYFVALLEAIDREDRERLLQAGFTEEQAETILDPEKSAKFLRPYLEASETGLAFRRIDGVCNIYVMGTKKLQEERAKDGLEACKNI